ncbi:uncharacterized protein Z518_01735 [Rhinocladiella mackenziei CBS 650.93]|uniref:Major facilitator superfamily (MFS) profile domain-containing protein n=1 Tax=Rhinocladiella mackenziei CBS 650.93 TaxID=1442369 RepID=A0A0D2J4L4_9EURO|nr:uncharacterized protein Z518_01735 [Rhinocladiella mackenziei CBS 650.93]KIX10651.1 hypothetical protein Z518_01735 [Rhinocladiella mackenziei CBS 650.93]
MSSSIGVLARDEYDADVLDGVLLHKPFLDAVGNPTEEWVIPWIPSSYSLSVFITCLIVGTFAFQIGRCDTLILGNVAADIEIGDREPANTFNAIAIILIAGECQLHFNASSPSSLEGACSSFQTLLDIIAKNRHAKGDAVLERLNDAPIDSEKVQATKREILLAIEAEDEAKSSLHWRMFLTSSIIDRTPMKIIRSFWLPMIREWIGSGPIAYFTYFFDIGCVPLYVAIERIGRRLTLMYGAIVINVLVLIFTALQAMPHMTSIQWAGIRIIFVFLFVFGYARQKLRLALPLGNRALGASTY